MVSSVLVAAASLLATPVAAQSSAVPTAVGPKPALFEGYYTHYNFDRSDGRVGMNGIGARLMWNPIRADYGAATLPSRFAIGLFGDWAPNQDKGFSVGHFGVQSDVSVVRSPLFGRVLPIVSLSVGALRTDRSGAAISQADFELGDRRLTMFALAPSLGTRVGVWRQLGLRADARDVMTFRDRTRHHGQFSAGLSLPF
jgi:hypothetical protein